MKWITTTVGLAFALLGGLWLLQGLAIIRLEPILCVGECEPVEGPSPTWAVLGAVMLAVGITVIIVALRKRADKRHGT